jgi:hypothetical protein
MNKALLKDSLPICILLQNFKNNLNEKLINIFERSAAMLKCRNISNNIY